MNKAILVGNLGKDVELKYTSDNIPVAKLIVATSEYYNNKERTEWHTIIVFGKQAEICKRYLAKGRTVSVDGRIHTRKWTATDGRDRYSTEIIANHVGFIGPGKNNENISKNTSSNGVYMDSIDVDITALDTD